MKPAPFTYQSVSSFDEAIRALSANPYLKVLAGGQSLVPMLNLRLASAEAVLDIGRIAALRETNVQPGSIHYGALTTHAAFEDGQVPDGSNGLMGEIASKIAYRAIRCRGTIGGALALADPAGDWVTAVIALQGRIHIAGPNGRRTAEAEAFILGPYHTALGDGELIEKIEIPKRPPTELWGHRKVVRKTGEYADSMAIALVDGTRKTSRVVLGSVDGAPIVMARAAKAALHSDGGIEIEAAIDSDLAVAGRDFLAAKMLMHKTTVRRAIKDALRQ